MTDLFAPSFKPLIGVIHLPALPGAPSHALSMAAIIEQSQRDAEALARAGFDGVIVENFGDAPFFADRVPNETVAAMTLCVHSVRRASGLPVGVNVLRNDGGAALAIAAVTDAAFVRVNVWVGARMCDQGVVQGEAARWLRLRASLGAEHVRVVADVGVKHSVPLAPWPIEDEAVEAFERGRADVLVVSGARTGAAADREEVARVKRASGARVWLGSGVTAESLAHWLEVADGVIVGSALRANGRAGGPIDEDRARAFAISRARF